ncbi:MAG: hypothetical protein MK098_10455 [Marinovum sp.]|nr:hypothetical protein [Marinovum sp.]
MSDSDSFIEEVTEEVRRDRVWALTRKYGWIPALGVFALVGGAAWNEYSKAQERAKAERLGDALMTALEIEDVSARASALDEITAETSGGTAVLAMLAAGQEAEAGESANAAARLESIATDAELPQIYRNIAGFKALLFGVETMDADTRRAGFEGLAQPGNPLRPLAEEQLALLEIETGATEAAINRLERLIEDAETSRALRDRSRFMIEALGGGASSP